MATKLHVYLPSNVFNNVYQLLRIVLQHTGDPSKENIDELLQVFIFTRLFVLKGTQRELFYDMASLKPLNMR